jgi:hypothetical protein
MPVLRLPFSFRVEPNATLRAAAPLYNPHSRNRRAAPRFSPTHSFDQAQDRFIPPVAPARIFPELDYSHALGIKRYTLGNHQRSHDNEL